MGSSAAKSASSCRRSPILSRLIALRNRHGSRLSHGLEFVLSLCHFTVRFLPTTSPDLHSGPRRDSKATDFFNSYHNRIRSQVGPIPVTNPFFYTSVSASRIQIYAVCVILNGTTLLGDVEGRDRTFIDGMRGIWELSVASIPFFCGSKASLNKLSLKKCKLLKG